MGDVLVIKLRTAHGQNYTLDFAPDAMVLITPYRKHHSKLMPARHIVAGDRIGCDTVVS